ncbi:PepSY-associated TM helix domain-containing protein [Pandoraea fibrosis]|uniref:PepSY domain-containing protein n=1 Tax=Pandoraea fibrosis TaxID=1891094 RepID=A0A5E4SFV6_9BURK|nr:PepSY-associated TM helix domain-containing protein [Pandoraea fibrosis]VVD73384.1 PepSY domain-containing protein [Pandoraea fibrosis]
MRAQTLRQFLSVHTWAGIVAGFALFIAMLGGALTVFHHEIERWEQPATRHAPLSLAQTEQLAEIVRAKYPAARAQMGVVLPNHSPTPFAYWQAPSGEWMQARLGLSADGGAPSLVIGDARPGLSSTINALHYSLSIPTYGLYLMGVVSLFYGMALISGVIVHLPRVTRDIFALRPGRNLKRFWQDAHNAIGVLSLPFHIVFALTGALLCLSLPLMMAFNVVTFESKLMSQIPQVTGAVPAKIAPVDGKPLDLRAVLARAEQAAPDMEATAIAWTGYGKPDAVAEVYGEANDSLGVFAAVAVRLNDGEIVGQHSPGLRDANHAVMSMIYGAHFGNFAGDVMRWVYFVLGLMGAVLVYSGNLLWLESRRKRNAAIQPANLRWMAKATAGVFLGTCLGIAVAFVGAVVAPGTTALSIFVATLAISVGFAALTAPAVAATGLLVATALACLTIPAVDAALTPDNLVHSLASGDWVLAGVDLIAIVGAVIFALFARATWRRARHGDPYSVWAHPTADEGRMSRGIDTSRTPQRTAVARQDSPNENPALPEQPDPAQT